LGVLKKLIQDEHPRVRLEALVALTDVPDPQAVAVAMKVLDKPRDRFIDSALKRAVPGMKDRWQPALMSGELQFDDTQHLVFLLSKSGGKDIAGSVRGLLTSAELSKAAAEGLLLVLAEVGNPKDLRTVFDRAVADASPTLCAALVEAATIRGRRPTGQLAQTVATLIDHNHPAMRVAGLNLAGAWKLRELTNQVKERIGAVKERDDVRVAAVAAYPHVDMKPGRLLSSLACGHRPIRGR
jgi:hypothetical protein